MVRKKIVSPRSFKLDLSREKIVQISLVVKDLEKVASRFADIFGIFWRLYDFRPKPIVLHDKAAGEVDHRLRVAIGTFGGRGWLGDIQIELIRPLGLRPGGCHQRFLDKHGNGIQHLSFGVQADYATVVNGMKRAGIGAEFSTSIKDHGVSVTYFASQDQLGGFQLEVVGKT
jgi:hypothetical protein